MADYLQGSQDFIPQIQQFNPDFNYYANTLATKENQYQQGKARLESIYGSAFNSPLTASDNIERRQKYFDTIQQDVQKASQLDLSLNQNIQTAQSIFEPILNDKDIVNDMNYTRGVQQSYQIANNYKNCVDSNKCGGAYWNEGVKALQYSQEDFQKASPDQRLRMSAPTFVPFQNVTQKAMKAAKDAGFNVSFDHNEGRYNVTDTNGELLLGSVKRYRDPKTGEVKEESSVGILPQYLYGMFGNDQSVQDMYATQASVSRRDYAKANAGHYMGGEEEAESAYLDSILRPAIFNINKGSQELSQIRDGAQTDLNAFEIKVKRDGADPETQDAYSRIENLLAKTAPTEEFFKNSADLINTAPNMDDLEKRRTRADAIVANSNFMNTINAASYDYAMGTAKRDMKADPYALSAYNNSLDISKAKQLKDYDNKIWFQQQASLGNLGGMTEQNGGISALLKEYNITSEDLAAANITGKIGPKELAKLQKQGAFDKPDLRPISTFVKIPKGELDPYETPYFQASDLVHSSAINGLEKSTDFVADQIKAMQNSFNNAEAIFGKDAVGVKAKLLTDMKNLLSGTGLNYNDMMRGEINLDKLSDKMSVDMGEKAMTIRQKDVAAGVYNDAYDNESLIKIQTALKAAQGLYKDRTMMVSDAVDKMVQSGREQYSGGKISKTDLDKDLVLYNVMFDKKGSQRSPEEAKQLYFNHAKDLFVDDPAVFNSKSGQSYPGKNKLGKTLDYFDENYLTVLKQMHEKMISPYSKPGSQDEGGAQLPAKGLEQTFIGNKPSNSDTKSIRNFILDVADNPSGNSIVISNIDNEGFSSVGGKTNDPNKAGLLGIISDRIKSGNVKDLNLTMQTEYVPKRFDKDFFSFSSSLDKARYTTSNDPSSFPGEFSSEAVLVKLTIPEEEYREMRGIKKDDPVSLQDRTISIKTIPGKNGFLPSLDPFIQKIQTSPEDAYLNKEGNSLPFNLGNKGRGMIQRDKKGQLILTQTMPFFNRETNLPDEHTKIKPIEEKSLENIYKVINATSEEAFNLTRAGYKNYLQSQNARSK